MDGVETPDGADAARSAAAGAGAWVFGYLLTYALAGSEVKNAGAVRLAEAVTGDQVAWKVIGWLFYNAHMVEVTVDVPVFGANAVNFIAESDGGGAVLLYLLPPLVLLCAGALAARLAGASGAESGAKAGALVVAGYLPLAVVGVFLFGVGSGDASAAPNLPMAVFLAGLVYPAVFGGAGGATLAAVTGGASGTGPGRTA